MEWSSCFCFIICFGYESPVSRIQIALGDPHGDQQVLIAITNPHLQSFLIHCRPQVVAEGGPCSWFLRFGGQHYAILLSCGIGFLTGSIGQGSGAGQNPCPSWESLRKRCKMVLAAQISGVGWVITQS